MNGGEGAEEHFKFICFTTRMYKQPPFINPGAKISTLVYKQPVAYNWGEFKKALPPTRGEWTRRGAITYKNGDQTAMASENALSREEGRGGEVTDR